MGANHIKIIAIGDSITYGFPFTPSDSWVHLAAERMDLTILNRGVNGDTTAGMLLRFDNDVIKGKPSHVIIMGGTNDAFARLAEEEVAANVINMLKMAAQWGITPLLGLPIPCIYPGDEYFLGLYREESRHYAVSNGIAVIDFCTAFLDPAGKKPKVDLYADAVHPNKEGYRAMADVVTDFLQNRALVDNS